MYSLYRAWFSGAGEESYPRLMDTLSPPDTVIRAGNDGEYHFVAHRSVLAAHSGYLKALLAATTADASTTSAVHDGAPPPPLITSITVPSTIGGEAFAPLLNYMYTGRLEVTLDNIYTVLLATHLLHMPGALEQCRAALLRLRAPVASPPAPPTSPQPSSSSAGGGSVLRPVPNRLLSSAAFCWPQSAQSVGHVLYPTAPRNLELPHLPTHLRLPPALSVLPGPIVAHKVASYGVKERSVSPASSTSQAAHQVGGLRSQSTSPELIVASSASSATQRSDDPQLQQESCARGSPSTSSERISIGDESQLLPQQQQTPRRRRASQKRRRQASVEKSSSTCASTVGLPGVVYDVACCDGPVRFHRVLNENYAPSTTTTTTTTTTSTTTASSSSSSVQQQQCNGRSTLAEEGDRENDENEHRPGPHDSRSVVGTGLDGNGENSRSGSSYTCGFCQHTFKSQYCYRKHARRHLLPTEGDNNNNNNNSSSNDPESRRLAAHPQPLPGPAARRPAQQQTSAGSAVQQLNQEGRKREVRLLDLNVQYYPCKICGSKFPSYYFVHKHRKLCHANVDEPQVRSNGADDQQLGAKGALQLGQPSTSDGGQQPA